MDIRKISIGADYKNAMHYIVGQKVLNNTSEIHLISCDNAENLMKVWIINNNQEVICWKSFNYAMPMSIEYNINF